MEEIFLNKILGVQDLDIQPCNMYDVRNYLKALSSRPSQFRCIKQIVNGTFGCGVYAVVRDFSIESSTLFVEDPTGFIGLTISDGVNRRPLLIQGNIIRIDQVDRLNDQIDFYTCRLQSAKIFKCFSYDYDESTNDSYELHHETKICYELESWEASRLLSWNLSRLPVRGKSYVNIVCQVLRQRAMKQNVILDVWDGCRLCIETTDPFNQDFSIPLLNGYSMRKCKLFSRLTKSRDGTFIAQVAVWVEPGMIDHYVKIIHSTPGDFVVLYNVEVNGNSLTVRSRHQKGTAVHIVNPRSVIGRQMTATLLNVVPESLNPFETVEEFVKYETCDNN